MARMHSPEEDQVSYRKEESKVTLPLCTGMHYK